MLGLIGLIIANHLHYNGKSPRRRDVYVGPPTFFLDPEVAPQFFHSRIATGCWVVNVFNFSDFSTIL